MKKAWLAVAAVSMTLMSVTPAHAQNAGSAAAAEGLFQEGRKLMDNKRYNEACPKFAASQKMAPAIGTLLNLADCYEKNNQLASAWASFHEAVGLAQRLGRANREQSARERADRLEPKLIKLSILSHSSNLEVKLDGNSIDPAALGSPIPVDAGKHTIEASAKGKKTFSKEFDVTDKQKSPTIDIPALDDEGGKAAAGDKGDKGAEKGKDEKGDKGVTEPPKEPPKGWSTQKVVGVVGMGAGVLSLGLGAYFAINASSKWSDVKQRCGEDLECPDQNAVDLADSAKLSGNLGTVMFVVGGVLGIGGAILFFTAPKERKPPPNSFGFTNVRMGVGAGSVLLQGQF